MQEDDFLSLVLTFLASSDSIDFEGKIEVNPSKSNLKQLGIIKLIMHFLTTSTSLSPLPLLKMALFYFPHYIIDIVLNGLAFDIVWECQWHSTLGLNR